MTIKFIIACVAACAAAVLLTAATGAAPLAATAAAPLPFRDGCVTKADHARILRFAASDGVKLIGVSLGNGPKTLVASHEYPAADLCSWIPFGRELVRRGYRVVAYDGRAQGSSGSPRPARRMYQELDVAAAVKAARSTGATDVALLGASMGAIASLVAATKITPAVDAIVSVSAPMAFARFNAVTAVRRLQMPILFIASEDDTEYAAAAQTLYDAAATGDKDVTIVAGYQHATRMFGLPEGRAARNDVLAWLDAHYRAR